MNIGGYPPRPQYPPNSYAPTPPPQGSQPGAANNMPPGSGPPQQYPGRPMPNHSVAGPHAQYQPYQNWVPPPAAQGPGSGPPTGNTGAPIANHVQGGKSSTPPIGGPPPPQGSSSPRPVNYLKQHLQHKGGPGYGSPSPTPPQGYGNGPSIHPGMPMGPPHHMGPPHGPTSMGPPTSTPPQSMMGNEMVASEHISQDNGISSSGSSSASGQHVVTSVITTGPDGAPIDEVSQQSTLSNASAGKKLILSY